ncbi:MAG TPA: glycine betaine ABC transporter substrate-binding protein [Burkholderiales bacterium]|nr:glycine betaine ABC transporter substrate-binding protein [Burkholderiales bacterium]
MRRIAVFALVWLCAAAQAEINVGSKRFTESYVLGEILTQKARAAGEAGVTHQQGLGNTAVVFAALKTGSIDLYPEYTGTLAFELLRLDHAPTLDELSKLLARDGLGVAIPLGFSNSYALGVREARAQALGLTRISDLVRQPALELGVSQEFLNRKDGWNALRAAYGLPQAPRGLDHGLAYEALKAGQIDVMDVYTTDAKVGRYGVRLLQDDRRFFPPYDAVVLYRLDFPRRYPKTWASLSELENRIDAKRMGEMNAAVELDGRSFAQVAGAFLGAPAANAQAARPQAARSFMQVLFGPDFGRVTLQHIALVFASLIPAVAVGVPLGVWAHRSRRAAPAIMAVVGLLQTIPALALLAFLITLMGTIGAVPAVVALFLYALLPIVRNTASGLGDIPPGVSESARALGLPSGFRLRRIELPLASRSILAGVKTAAVISVGAATIAAFIGAGGYGERIVAGLAVNDAAVLLSGAVPAAALALIVQWGFDLLERRLVPAGLRLGEGAGRA